MLYYQNLIWGRYYVGNYQRERERERERELPARSTPLETPIVHSLYQLYTSFTLILIKFPKAQRYTLGSECQKQLLATLEAVVTAAGSSDKEAKLTSLRLAAVKLDLLRLNIRLSKDTKCITNKVYLTLESKIHEIGRMLGGWIKSLS